MSNRKNDIGEKSRSRPRVENLPGREEELKPEQAEAAEGGLLVKMKPTYITSYVAPESTSANEIDTGLL